MTRGRSRPKHDAQYTLLPASSVLLDSNPTSPRQERIPRKSDRTSFGRAQDAVGLPSDPHVFIATGDAWDWDWECLSFVEDKAFHYFIAIVLTLNVLVMSGQTDYPKFPVWWYADHIFLIIYVAEIVCRLLYLSTGARHGNSRREGKEGRSSRRHVTSRSMRRIESDDSHGTFFSCCFTWDKTCHALDIVVVILGIVELWLAPLVKFFLSSLYGNPRNWAWLEVLRLMRLLRLLYFIRVFPMMSQLVKGFSNMYQSFVLTFMVILTFSWVHAVVLTHFLGHGLLFGRSEDQEEGAYKDALASIEENFCCISVSLVSLFRITTTDDWYTIAHPLVYLDSRWMILFIEFILFTAWTMISVLTAVASDSMVAAASDRQEANMRQQEKKRKDFRDFLGRAFHQADADGNGFLDKKEFNDLIGSRRVRERISASGASMKMEDLQKTWDMLVGGSGMLTIDEFVVGLGYLQEGLSTKHVLNISTEIKRLHILSEKHFDSISSKMDNLRRTNVELLSNLKEQELELRQQVGSMVSWTQETKQHYPDAFPEKVLAFLDPVTSYPPSPPPSPSSPRIQRTPRRRPTCMKL